MRIFVVNGPNLNMLGKREPELYGHQTLEDLESILQEAFGQHSFEFFQSNHEGDLISQLQRLPLSNAYDAVLINPGGLSHTSVSLRDSLSMLSVPKVEVHISNIHAREEFRHHSITAGACDAVIAGLGFDSYSLGVRAAELIIKKRRESAN
ncbi:MAG: type II 3-dehydroquinate dehydratase [Rhodothermaceae bacterium]|nr:type II 3-dehydroquinate dehydratase [Rhodothermaceae bacterium]